MISVALDIRHEAKEFEIAKQQLVLTRVITIRGNGHTAGAVQHALCLRQIVAMQKGLRVGASKLVSTCCSGKSA